MRRYRCGNGMKLFNLVTLALHRTLSQPDLLSLLMRWYPGFPSLCYLTHLRWTCLVLESAYFLTELWWKLPPPENLRTYFQFPLRIRRCFNYKKEHHPHCPYQIFQSFVEKLIVFYCFLKDWSLVSPIILLPSSLVTWLSLWWNTMNHHQNLKNKIK